MNFPSDRDDSSTLRRTAQSNFVCSPKAYRNPYLNKFKFWSSKTIMWAHVKCTLGKTEKASSPGAFPTHALSWGFLVLILWRLFQRHFLAGQKKVASRAFWAWRRQKGDLRPISTPAPGQYPPILPLRILRTPPWKTVSQLPAQHLQGWLRYR